MTLTISAADLATVRRRSGDTSSELTDAVVDAIYASTTLGNLDLGRTTYYALVELYGLASGLVDKSNEVDSLSISSSQKFDHLEKLLAFWGQVTGLGGGVGLGSASVDVYRADSDQTDAPDYSAGAL